MLLFGFYCDLLYSCFLPTASLGRDPSGRPTGGGRWGGGANRQRSRSIQYRLSRSRMTSSSAESLKTKKKPPAKWCEGGKLRISPQVAAELTNNAAVLPDMSASCPPAQKIIDCPSFFFLPLLVLCTRVQARTAIFRLIGGPIVQIVLSSVMEVAVECLRPNRRKSFSPPPVTSAKL